jgi:hypothetical protein
MTGLVLVSGFCAQLIETAGMISEIQKYSSLDPVESLFFAIKANLPLIILVNYM